VSGFDFVNNASPNIFGILYAIFSEYDTTGIKPSANDRNLTSMASFFTKKRQL